MTAYVYADLINDVYTVNGVTQAGGYTDIFMQQASHSEWPLLKTVDGLVNGSFDDFDTISLPVSNTANTDLAAALNTAYSSGCIITLEFSLGTDGTEGIIPIFRFGATVDTASITTGNGASMVYKSIDDEFFFNMNGGSTFGGSTPGSGGGSPACAVVPASIVLRFRANPSVVRNTVSVNSGAATYTASESTDAWVDVGSVFEFNPGTNNPSYLTKLVIEPYADDPDEPPPPEWVPPDPDTLAVATRVGVLLRVATDPVIRLWSGLVRDLAIPVGGAETTDGAIYQSMGQLTGMPQLGAALNGEAERVEFTMSGVAVTGEVSALAHDEAGDIRGVAVDVGLVTFDDDWQLIPPVFWLWSGTADSLTVERTGDAQNPTRTLKLSAGSVFTGRRRPNLNFATDIDQRRRSADDAFFDQVAKLQQGTTKVWGVG